MTFKQFAALAVITLATFAVGFGATVYVLNNVTLHVVVDRIDSIESMNLMPRRR